MDRSRFFAALRLRTSGVFGTSLSQSQVDGMEVILDAGQRAGLPLKHLAYALATAYHETGCKMQPVNESLYYTSAARIREVWPKRFTSVAAAIPYVRNPQGLANRVYADRMGNGPEASGDGWRYRGRALPQLTGEENYRKASKLVGVDLVQNPEAANDADISALILVEGMRAGLFTARKLADFDVSSPTSSTAYDYVTARSIINDDVRTNGQLVAGYAKAFEIALHDAVYDAPAAVAASTERPAGEPLPDPVNRQARQPPVPQPTTTVKRNRWSAIATLLTIALRKILRGA